MAEAEADPADVRRIVAEELDRRAERAPGGWLSDNVKWIVVSLMVPLVTWMVGCQQQHRDEARADADRQIADARAAAEAQLADARNDVTAMTALLPSLSDPDERRASLALVVLTRLKDAQHGDARVQALFDGVLHRIDVQRASGSPEEASLGARSLEAVQNAAGSTSQTAATPVAVVSTAAVQHAADTRPSRVYAQVFTDAQRSEALAVQAALRDEGVPVPGIEHVAQKPGTGLVRRQIRIFADGDVGAARWTQSLLARAGLGDWPIVKARTSNTVPAGQVELWWPSG